MGFSRHQTRTKVRGSMIAATAALVMILSPLGLASAEEAPDPDPSQSQVQEVQPTEGVEAPAEEPKADPEPKPQPEPAPDPEPAPNPEPDPEPESEPAPEQEQEPAPEPDTETAPETETKPDPEETTQTPDSGTTDPADGEAEPAEGEAEPDPATETPSETAGTDESAVDPGSPATDEETATDEEPTTDEEPIADPSPLPAEPAEDSASPSPSPDAEITPNSELSDDVWVEVYSTDCSVDGAPTQVEIELFNMTDAGVGVSWQLTGSAGVIASGEAMVNDSASVAVPDLGVGSYHLSVSADGQTIGGTSFQVAECMTGSASAASASGSCGTATFSNPAGNPAISVVYGGPDATDIDDFSFVEVAPGGSATISTKLERLTWVGYWLSDQGDSGIAGSGELQINQDCDTTPTPKPTEPANDSVTIVVGQVATVCTQGNATGSASVSVSTNSDQPVSVSWEAESKVEVPGLGTALWGGVSDITGKGSLELTEVAPGSYTLTVFNLETLEVVATRDFTVMECVALAAAPADLPETDPVSTVGGLADTGATASLLPLGIAALALLIAGLATISRRRGANDRAFGSSQSR